MERKFEIGRKIKNKRLELNLRMDDVAKRVGITRSTLWSVENGSGYYAKWLDTPDQMSRFMLLPDGRIHRYNATNRFLGYYTDDDNALRVDANAGASGGSTAITFERESQDNAN